MTVADSPLAAILADDPEVLEACRILVVDDSHMVRAMVGAFLTGAGFHRIDYASSGAEAMAALDRQRPGLLILDDELPDLDGLEVCRTLRNDPRHRDLPVLVQTSTTGPQRRTEAFEAGASDVLNKPVNRDELLARARIQLETGLLIHNLQLFQQRIASELTMARESYAHLLPTDGQIARVRQRTGLTVRWHTALSPETGGDICGVLDAGAGPVGVYVLDVDGGGVSAALNAITLHTMVQQPGVSWPDDPATALTLLNQRSLSLFNDGQCAAFVGGYLDPDAGCFRYAAAGGVAPVLIQDGAITLGEAAGSPLGLSAESVYQTHTLPFPPGAVLLLVSDGLLRPFADREVPDQALADLVRDTLAGGAPDDQAGFDRLVAVLSDRLGDRLEDDLAMLFIARGRS